MSLVICVLTVMSVDWVTNEKQSVPMRIPCEGFDHITRLEIISTTTEAEYQQLETVLYGQMGSYERPSNNMVEKDPKVGPKRMGNHYSDFNDRLTYFISKMTDLTKNDQQDSKWPFLYNNVDLTKNIDRVSIILNPGF